MVEDVDYVVSYQGLVQADTVEAIWVLHQYL